MRVPVCCAVYVCAAACDVDRSPGCPLPSLQPLSSAYMGRPEMNVVYLEHSVDVAALDLYTDAAEMTSRGLRDPSGNLVDLCARAWNGACILLLIPLRR